MTSALYTAQAHVTGGRADGHGRTADGRLEVDLRQPKELGGDGEGTNPEQLFAIGYAACFAASLAIVGQRKQLRADDAAIDAKVMLIPAGNGGFKLGVELEIELPSIADATQASDLVRVAHQVCPYSNATRGNIDVALVVDGTRL
ncbi:organic hydroperoxide resistance protein [Streptosporangium sp. NBC_01756]|uniref:organic hydroperoxide resistance protein n=1 Tax=Streptosporangium sp. NBC_01756 TaxID=2975950 RepID=UPI002DD98DB1|nr:organic hydroperoxide resistance protein [Streptosporangium sp. NBC_01756]WSC87035.1 organic hydroperoxide resistance protein [Streptosporangium sp. NBC_01756]